MSIQTIEDSQELKEHITALIAIEPKFTSVYKQVGVPDLRHNEGGFAQIMRAMVGFPASLKRWARAACAQFTTTTRLSAPGR